MCSPAALHVALVAGKERMQSAHSVTICNSHECWTCTRACNSDSLQPTCVAKRFTADVCPRSVHAEDCKAKEQSLALHRAKHAAKAFHDDQTTSVEGLTSCEAASALYLQHLQGADLAHGGAFDRHAMPRWRNTCWMMLSVAKSCVTDCWAVCCAVPHTSCSGGAVPQHESGAAAQSGIREQPASQPANHAC